MAEAVRPRKEKKLKTKMKSMHSKEIEEPTKLAILNSSIDVQFANKLTKLSISQANDKEEVNIDDNYEVDEKLNITFGIINMSESQMESTVASPKKSEFRELEKDMHRESFQDSNNRLSPLKCDSVDKEKYVTPSAPLIVGSDLARGSVIQRCFEIELPSDEILLVDEKEIKIIEKTDIKPYSELQLLALYENVQLEEKGIFVLNFLEEEKKTNRSKFYEIVMNYYRAQTNLIGTEKEIQEKESDYKKSREQIWSFDEHTTTEEGTCEDDKLLFVNYNHVTSVFLSEMASLTVKQLKHVRELIFDAHSLHIYVSEMSKLQVENYLLNISMSSTAFIGLPKNEPIKCMLSEPDINLHSCKKDIKECISVLFSFCRRNIKDIKFVRDLRNWLSDLISILLRVATIKDHLFILNHLMRCPAGTGDWASHFLQIAVPVVTNEQSSLGSSLLDHLVTILATLLQPAEEREKFLQHYQDDVIFKDEDPTRDTVWIIVDSSGEDEEDSTETWHYFKENDVVQLLNQIPFEDLFRHILLIEKYTDGNNSGYDISKITAHSMMKLFAFSTLLVKLFQDGLRTYSQARFKGVTKRISRLIRHTVHYVSDHWQNYAKYCLLAPDRQDKDSAMTQRLQVQYDEFFEYAVKAVFLSPRRGAWQFLAVIPYTCVSLHRLSKIAYKLHIGYKGELNCNSDEDWLHSLALEDTVGRFQDQLLKLGESETYFLLTAMANMTIVRDGNEKEFIEIIVSSIFTVTFVDIETRDDLNRTGRDLFITISSIHSFTISTLLMLIQEKIEKVGGLSLYLFRCLPLDQWQPTEEDLQCITYWLLYTPPSSLENQLSRIILSKINWEFDPQGDSLVLPKATHERLALTVVELALKISSRFGQGNLLSEGVKHVTSVVYAPSSEQICLKWCWLMLNQLHLHQLDRPVNEVRMLLSNPHLMLQGINDPSTCPSLSILKKGISSKHPIAIYASMLVSTWGHSVPEICNQCPENLDLLITNGYCESAINILYFITPLFFNRHEEFMSDAKFITALQNLLMIDQTYVNLAKSYIVSDQVGIVNRLFAAMITEQLVNHKRYNLENGSSIVTFWIHILTTIPNWRCNLNALRVIDAICQFALFEPHAWQSLKFIFKEQAKILSGEEGGKSGLGSLLNWVSVGSTASTRSLLTKTSSAAVPWFALAVLICDAQEEINSGLWKNLLKEISENLIATVDISLKNTCNFLEIDLVPSNTLTIYRLGQQLIDIPTDHPAFPLTAQIFFILHLSRTPRSHGQYDCSSVISKFYEGYVNGNFLNKIKMKFNEVAKFYETKIAEKLNRMDPDEEDNSFVNLSMNTDLEHTEIYEKEYFIQLNETIRSMNDWMNENRLYETGLYLPALSPQLKPDKLNLIFQESWDLWLELTNLEYLSNCTADHIKLWSTHRSHVQAGISPTSPSTPTHSDSLGGISSSNANPTLAILKRLKEYDAPKPAPQLPKARQKKAPIKMGATLDKDSVLYDIERYTGFVIDNAHTMMLKSKEMCALDCVYVELMPKLWVNTNSKIVLQAKCKPNRNSKYKECTGPAKIVVEFNEKRLNEGINARLDQNRHQRQELFNSCMHAPPLKFCEAAVHLDALVSHVVHWYKNLHIMGDDEQISTIISYGRELFYQLVQLTSEETSAFPPAKQLIASCADSLGQEFLHGHVNCQEALVVQVLNANQSVGVLLSPHFTPMVASTEIFIDMYGSINPYIAAKPDLCFMLLSKFEMEGWLRKTKINAINRSQLINQIGQALSSVLILEDESTIMCLELYRVHLRALLNVNFPEHLSQVIALLLDISLTTTKDCGNVALNIWYDLLNVLSYNVARFSPEMTSSQLVSAIRTYSQTQSILSAQSIKDLLTELSRHFIHFRLQFGLYGLYPKYKLFVKPISCLLAMISQSYILTANLISNTTDINELCLEIWGNLDGLWASWIAPLGGKMRESCPQWIQELYRDKRILLPWTPGDLTVPGVTVKMHANTLAFFHEAFIGCNVLSLYLEYYNDTYANPEVKDHVLSVIHSHMSALPWHHMNPTLRDVEIFSKIINEFLPECHSFVGTIFIQISWNKVVKQFVDSCRLPSVSSLDASDCDTPTSSSTPRIEISSKKSSNSTVVKLHILLLNILIRISMEPSVRQSGLLHPLLLIAESFEWRLVDSKNFESILNWFVMSCDPRIFLNMQNRNPIDISIIRLLHVSAGYTSDTQIKCHRSGSLKRRLLVRALCRLLTMSATRHKALLSARKSLFEQTFAILLTQMEDTIVDVIPKESQYAEGFALACEPVSLIGGGASTPQLQEVCRDSMIHWLGGSHPSRDFLLPLTAAISKGILHLQNRNPLIEQSIVALFDNADSFPNGAGLTWPEIVDQLSFPLTNPAPLLSVAAQENHLLLVFAHTRWRILRAQPSDHAFILTNLIDLLSVINPSESCEKGLLLIVAEVILLLQNQLSVNSECVVDYQNVWKSCQNLCDLLSMYGEDRASQGLFAAIGFGKKSSLSVRIRLICKCLHTFLSTQLLSPGFFSSINEHAKSRAEIDLSNTNDEKHEEESMKCIRQLIALRSNASYSEFKSALNFAIDFILDARHSILQTDKLLGPLTAKLYPNDLQLKYLSPLVESESVPPSIAQAAACPPETLYNYRTTSGPSVAAFDTIVESSAEQPSPGARPYSTATTIQGATAPPLSFD